MDAAIILWKVRIPFKNFPHHLGKIGLDWILSVEHEKNGMPSAYHRYVVSIWCLNYYLDTSKILLQ